MNFSERPPSEQWAALKYAGAQFAEVWFKPDGELFALTFRVPQSSFQIPGMDQLLTAENLLKAVGIATEEVESWRREGDSDSDDKESHSELSRPLTPPPQDVAHLVLYVSLKPPQPAVAERGEPGAEDYRGEAARTRSALEDDPGIGSEHRYVTHQHGRPSDGNGRLDEEDVDGRTKSTRPELGRSSMEQGKEPRSLRPAEGERIYPSFDLGGRRARKEEA